MHKIKITLLLSIHMCACVHTFVICVSIDLPVQYEKLPSNATLIISFNP